VNAFYIRNKNEARNKTWITLWYQNGSQSTFARSREKASTQPWLQNNNFLDSFFRCKKYMLPLQNDRTRLPWLTPQSWTPFSTPSTWKIL